jgi:uncharacterized protein
MIKRTFWTHQIEQAWKSAPIVWLCGARRSGKTTLAKGLGEDRMVYLNCDLPSVEDRIKDPEIFYRSCDKPIVVFDEIHQLRDPSRILKIGADQFPKLKILATGSSTLAATKKFKDSLTGRKRVVHLTPVLWDELAEFAEADILKRLFAGGLPPALLAPSKSPAFYREWMDSFFARDVQRLFSFRSIDKFNALFEYVLKQSGGQLETSRAASALGIARLTVESHLRALTIMQALTLLRPFHGGGQAELIKVPKAYGFDTGFVSFVKGWDPLRPADCGVLWEHVVLESLQAAYPDHKIHYWRDKSGREIDFVIPGNRSDVAAIECKWSPAEFDPVPLLAFRRDYPRGRNYLVSPIQGAGYDKRFKDLDVRVCHPGEFLKLTGGHR